MSGYAHHAYTLPAGPYYVPPERDDVTIGSLSRLSNALNLAARAHAIPAGVPIYLTEFGVQSKPNKYLGVSAPKQAEYDAICRTHRLRKPARGRLLPVPARGRPDRRPGTRRQLPDRPGVRQRHAQAAVLRLADPADGDQAAARRVAVGLRAPGDAAPPR